ncbi:MAG: hypothetical protein AAF430_15285 [Myxococcota bacterium]
MHSWVSRFWGSNRVAAAAVVGVCVVGWGSAATAQFRTWRPPTAVMIPIQTDRSVSAGTFVESESWIGPWSAGVSDQVIAQPPCDGSLPPELCESGETGSGGAAGWQDSLISRNAVIAEGGASAAASQISASIDGTSGLGHTFSLTGWTDYEADGTLSSLCDTTDGGSVMRLESDDGTGSWTPVFEVAADCVPGAPVDITVRQKGLLAAGTYRLLVSAYAVAPSDGQNQSDFDVEFRISAGSPFTPGPGSGPTGPSVQDTQQTIFGR